MIENGFLVVEIHLHVVGGGVVHIEQTHWVVRAGHHVLKRVLCEVWKYIIEQVTSINVRDIKVR